MHKNTESGSGIMKKRMETNAVNLLKKIIATALLISVVVLGFGGLSVSTRGTQASSSRQPLIERPVIKDGSVYTAWGTLLRGLNVTYFIDAEHLSLITQYGFNSAHYYIEEGPYWEGSTLGGSAERIDLLVKEGEKNGFYVVITIGGLTGSDEEIEFLPKFWEYYAERYRDNKNVIFEIANEMWFPSPFTSDDIDLAGEAYRIIRKHAPDTMVLFYSYSHMWDWDICLNALRQTEQNLGGISWKNEAVAFHAYEAAAGPAGAEVLAGVIKGLREAGYPIINTELPNREEMSDFSNADLIRVCEETGTAWLCFLDIANMASPAFWQGSVELANVTWTPDYGTWPIPDALYPYEIRRAVDDMSGTSDARQLLDGGKKVYEVSNGGELSYERVAFGVREPLSVTLTVKSPQAAAVVVLERGPAGDHELARCVVSAAGDYQNITTYLISPVSGLATIVLRAETAGKPVSVSGWRFNLPPPDAAQSFTMPYDKPVAAAKYSFCSDGIKRLPSDDSGAVTPLSKDLKVGGVTANSYIEFDYVRYVKRDVTFKVRAKTLAGGQIAVVGGDFNERNPNYCELGVVDINGTRGGWQEFSCRLEFEDWPDFFFFGTDPRPWQLRLEFRAEYGQASGELFEVSEFTFDTSGAPQTVIIDQTALTGQRGLRGAVVNVLAMAGIDAGVSGYGCVRSLVISGTLEEEDFRFIREELSGLWTLDLGGITNTVLPEKALNNEGYKAGTLANLYKLTLPEGLERIEDYAIADCLRLATIGTAGVHSPENALTLPLGLKHLGEGAFVSAAFTTADLSTTSIDSVGHWPFAYCEKLEYLKLMPMPEMYIVSLVPPSQRLSAIEFTSVVAPQKHSEAIGVCPEGAVIYYPAGGSGYTTSWLLDGGGQGGFILLAADTAPKVVSVEPRRSDPGSAPVSGELMVTFDQPMKTSVAGSLNINNRGGDFAPTLWTNGNRTCIIPYSGLDDATSYTFTIQGFENAAGTHLVFTNDFGFTTVGGKKDVEKEYSLTVVNGTGSEKHEASSPVAVSVNPASAVKKFDIWELLGQPPKKHTKLLVTA